MRQRLPTRLTAAGAGRGLLLGLVALFVVYVAWLLVEPGGSASSSKWLYNLLLVGSAFVCLRSPRRTGKEKAAWTCLGVTLILWAAGDFYYTLFLWDEPALPPTVTDWLWLASYPFLYASIALLVRARALHFERSLLLDAVVAALAVAAIGAAVLFGAVVESTGGSPAVAAMNIAYPLADALLLGLVVSVLALTGWRIDRSWLCIVGGTAVLALADSAYLYQAVGGISNEMTILDAGWPLAMLLLAAAAWLPGRQLGAVRLEGVRLLAVPAVFGVTALAILVYGQFETLNTPAVILAATAMLAVIARMALTFRDKLQLLAAARIEAETDALTGIGNRRKLMTDLEATLHERRAGGADAARPRRLQGLQRHFRAPGRGRAARAAREEARRQHRHERRGVPHRRRRVLRPRPDRDGTAPVVRRRRPDGAAGAWRGIPHHRRPGKRLAATGGRRGRRGAQARRRADVRREGRPQGLGRAPEPRRAPPRPVRARRPPAGSPHRPGRARRARSARIWTCRRTSSATSRSRPSCTRSASSRSRTRSSASRGR